MRYTLDIETNLAHDHIWMVAWCDEDGNASWSTQASDIPTDATAFIGHNLLHFDLPVMERVWGWTTDVEIIDTLVLSRLVHPSIEGGHSLKAWAERAGMEQKQDFSVEDFDAGLTDQMIEYCMQDCVANWSVYTHLMKLYEEYGFEGEALDLEHAVSRIVRQQETNGFVFDFAGASAYYAQQKERMNEIDTILKETFPPLVTERWSEKTGKRLKDHVEEFNVASRQQIARRLESKGAKWKKRTEKGAVVVDESTLADQAHVPEASLVLEYLTLGKRSGMIKSWLDSYEEDGRIHGYVNTCGTVTGRMTHSRPNMAQIPSDSDYRTFFTVPEGHKLVGCDASGLELRMLAHYMKDEEFTNEILDGDIHTANQNAFGCETRNQAKTLIYALLYGAGDAKLGSTVGGSAAKGAAMRQSYETRWPAYRDLIRRVQKIGKSGTVPALDGRRIHIRSEHAALNSLLQSAGAIVMKKALVLATEKLDAYGYPYKHVANVHDEFQLEVPEEYADRVGACVRNAIRQAGRDLGLRCPLDGEYMVGDNWSQTH
jgi:DNA polymerase I-like protein with 3'-5' exonuclease and polymerase domains